MTDEYTEITCGICGDVVHSYYYESGYDSRFYGRKTHKIYEKREIKIPEGSSYDAIVCMDCSENTGALLKLVEEFRLKHVNDKIKSIENNIKSIENSIENYKEDIRQLNRELEVVLDQKQNLEESSNE